MFWSFGAMRYVSASSMVPVLQDREKLVHASRRLGLAWRWCRPVRVVCPLFRGVADKPIRPQVGCREQRSLDAKLAPLFKTLIDGPCSADKRHLGLLAASANGIQHS